MHVRCACGVYYYFFIFKYFRVIDTAACSPINDTTQPHSLCSTAFNIKDQKDAQCKIVRPFMIWGAELPSPNQKSVLLDELHDVLVVEHVRLADDARVVLDARAPHERVLELAQ